MTTGTATARTYVAIAGLLAFGAVFASLGGWQWQRSETSRATRAQFDEGGSGDALVTLPERLDEAARYQQIEIRGEYRERPQFLLDNMLQDGVAGYHVLSPLRIPGRREHVLVNRGWVPAGSDRRVVPHVPVEGGSRIVAGRLERLPRPGLRLGADAEGGARADAPVVVLQYPTAVELARRLGVPVYDYQILLDPSAPEGYVREWRAPGVAPERHLAYAGQWWVLAIGAFGAAIVITHRTTRRATRET